MPNPVTPPAPPHRPPAPRRARTRRATAERKLRILERLTAGGSIAEVALAEDLTPRRVRQLIAAILAERAVDPPAGFIPLQIGRLSDALRIAHAKMMAGDLEALDRVIRVIGELDRYYGFAHPETAPAPASLGAAAAPGRRPPSARPAARDAEAEIFRPATL